MRQGWREVASDGAVRRYESRVETAADATAAPAVRRGRMSPIPNVTGAARSAQASGKTTFSTADPPPFRNGRGSLDST